MQAFAIVSTENAGPTKTWDHGGSRDISSVVPSPVLIRENPMQAIPITTRAE